MVPPVTEFSEETLEMLETLETLETLQGTTLSSTMGSSWEQSSFVSEAGSGAIEADVDAAAGSGISEGKPFPRAIVRFETDTIAWRILDDPQPFLPLAAFEPSTAAEDGNQLNKVLASTDGDGYA